MNRSTRRPLCTHPGAVRLASRLARQSRLLPGRGAGQDAPPAISLRPQMPAVYDQGQLGSCTANSIGAILEFNELKQDEAGATTPSRLFIDYNERLMEGTVKQDGGAQIRDGIKSVAQVGAPPEPLWPYIVAKFAVKPRRSRTRRRRSTRPSATDACCRTRRRFRTSSHRASRSRRVYGLRVVRDRRRRGRNRSDAGANGAGTRRTCGRRDRYKTIKGSCISKCRNSWGPTWADQGYFWMPAGYLTSASLASDFWVIEQVE